MSAWLMSSCRQVTLAFVLGACVIWIGCGDKIDPIQTFESVLDPSEDQITYTSEIQALLETHCLLCHTTSNQGAERNGAPINVNFDTYGDIVIWMSEASLRIQSGTMPPTGGIPQDDRMLFQRWIDDGFLE